MEKIGEIGSDLLFLTIVVYLLLMYYGKVKGRDKVKVFARYSDLSKIVLWIDLIIFISIIALPVVG